MRERKEQVVSLRENGLTVAQTAKALGLSTGKVIHAFDSALRGPRAHHSSMRRLQEQRLEKLLRACNRIIDAASTIRVDDAGNPKPIHDVATRLKAMAEARGLLGEINKLLGLYAPTKHRHAGDPTGAPIQTTAVLTMGEIAALDDDQLAEVQQRAAADLSANTAAVAAGAFAAGAGEEAEEATDDGSGAG